MPKHNKYANLAQINAILDYHIFGPLTTQQIIRICDEFLTKVHELGEQRALIITGKGHHSPNGAVIRPLLLEHLKIHPAVQLVTSGRRDRGGEGALEIILNGE